MIRVEYDEHGHIIHNGARYTAIKELALMLNELKIPYEMIELCDGYQINVYEEYEGERFRAGDAVQHFGSYGAEQDLIEIYGFNLDDVVGYLTAEQALEYFIDWHKKSKKEERSEDSWFKKLFGW